MKTLEEIFIKQYEEKEQELAKAQLRIKELENQKNEKVDVDQPVVIKTFSKECCQLDVSAHYSIERSEVFKNMTSAELKAIIEDDEKIKEYAQMRNSDRYSNNSYVGITTRAFPYSAVIQGCVVLIDVHKNYDKKLFTNCCVLGSKEHFEENCYFDIKEKDRLYEYGLKVFKEELQKVYENKLKKEAEENG